MCGLSYLCSLNGGLSEGFIADEKYRDVRDLFCMENLTVDEGKFNVIFFVYYRCLEALSYLPKPNASDNSNAILQELYGMEKTVYRGRDYTHQRASFIKLLTLLRTDAEEEEKA